MGHGQTQDSYRDYIMVLLNMLLTVPTHFGFCRSTDSSSGVGEVVRDRNGSLSSVPRADGPYPLKDKCIAILMQGLLFWLCKGGFKVSSGIVKWHRNSYGADFHSLAIAGPAMVSPCRATVGV